MNKIITANLNGFIFPIDEIAYDVFKVYLQELRGKIKDHETITDIENRIAELFNHLLQNDKKAILENDVRDIMAQIGDVNEFENPEDSSHFETRPRKLYRDIENKKILGVCSGLSVYLNIDVNIIRLIFILLMFTSIGVFLYIIIAAVIPFAITDDQKSQMQGKPIDLKNINDTLRKTAKDSMESLKLDSHRIKSSKFMKIAASFAMGFLLLWLIPTILAAIFSAGFISFAIESIQRYFFADIQNIILPLIAIIVIVIIPLIHIFYQLIRVIFEGQNMHRTIKILLNMAWLCAVFYLVYVAVILGRDFSGSITLSNIIQQKPITKDSTLYIHSVKFHTTKGNDTFEIEDTELQYFMNNKFNENVALKIESTLDSAPYIRIQRFSLGSKRTALTYAKSTNYPVKFEGSNLLLRNYFTLDENTPWRNQKVTVQLFVPIGYTVKIDKSCSPIISEVNNQELFLDHDGVESAIIKSSTSGLIYIHQ